MVRSVLNPTVDACVDNDQDLEVPVYKPIYSHAELSVITFLDLYFKGT